MLIPAVFVQCYRAHGWIKVSIFWTWQRRFLRLCTHNMYPAYARIIIIIIIITICHELWIDRHVSDSSDRLRPLYTNKTYVHTRTHTGSLCTHSFHCLATVLALKGFPDFCKYQWPDTCCCIFALRHLISQVFVKFGSLVYHVKILPVSSFNIAVFCKYQ